MNDSSKLYCFFLFTYLILFNIHTISERFTEGYWELHYISHLFYTTSNIRYAKRWGKCRSKTNEFQFMYISLLIIVLIFNILHNVSEALHLCATNDSNIMHFGVLVLWIFNGLLLFFLFYRLLQTREKYCVLLTWLFNYCLFVWGIQKIQVFIQL